MEEEPSEGTGGGTTHEGGGVEGATAVWEQGPGLSLCVLLHTATLSVLSLCTSVFGLLPVVCW